MPLQHAPSGLMTCASCDLHYVHCMAAEHWIVWLELDSLETCEKNAIVSGEGVCMRITRITLLKKARMCIAVQD